MKSAKPRTNNARRQGTGKATAAKRERVTARQDAARTAVSSAAAADRDPVEAVGELASRTTSEATDLTRSQLHDWIEAGAVVAKGTEDIGKAWLRLTQRSMEDGVAAATAILAARSLDEVVRLQSDYARTSLDNFVTESMRISELSTRMARAAVLPSTARRDAAAGRS